MKLNIERYGSHRNGFVYFVCGEFRQMKKHAQEDLRQLKVAIKEAAEIRKENETLRARLAEIESQEPVAFAYYSDKYKKPMLEQTENARGYEGEWKIVPLFAAPVASPDVASKYEWLCDKHLTVCAENQSLKTEIHERSNKAQVAIGELEANIRSLKTELEAANALADNNYNEAKALLLSRGELRQQIAELKTELEVARKEASRFKGIADMWLWETVNERAEHTDARKLTQKAFKESAANDQKGGV